MCIISRGVSSAQCPVSSVQDKEQNQEHEEKGRRRKPLIIDPTPMQVFFSPLGQEKVAVMCCKDTCKRGKLCVVKVPGGGH